MDLSLSLAKFRIFESTNNQTLSTDEEDRLHISRTRRAIDLMQQELIQLALLEERQKSA